MNWKAILLDYQVLSRGLEGLIVLYGLWLIARAIRGSR